jgi:hypothetical protein
MIEHEVSRTAGKWGRAISIVEDMPTAQMSPEIYTVMCLQESERCAVHYNNIYNKG